MANTLDFKKEYKELYLPKTEPTLIKIPEMIYVSIIGKGNPDDPNGEYKNAIETLYGIQYTIKMSKKGTYAPDGYFDYVVPPLEGFWWSDIETEMKNKSEYNWISIIRLPEYVTKGVFKWACEEAGKKKKIDTTKAKLLKINEGLCVQCMHIGSFDEESKTLKLIEKFIEDNNLIKDINNKRRHHEIYLSDPRKVEEAKMKTVIRIPVKNK
ncbi:GyrI-like domain-containing protein [Treponema primitia]|uniref:GyrI-like domain-containing protein n=1 Tax=Treponema primitia TaxID=88058 RepID=UPI00398127BE